MTISVSTVYHNQELALLVVRFKTPGYEGQAAYLYDWELNDEAEEERIAKGEPPQYMKFTSDDGFNAFIQRVSYEYYTVPTFGDVVGITGDYDQELHQAVANILFNH